MRVLARKLASPSTHPTQVCTQVQLASTCDYLPVCFARALYHALQIWSTYGQRFLFRVMGVSIFVLLFSFPFLGNVFNKTILPLVLVGCEIVIASSYLTRTQGITVSYMFEFDAEGPLRELFQLGSENHSL